MAVTLEKVKKYLNYLFINTTPGAAAGSETWTRVGKSTEWTDTMNVAQTTYDFIEDSAPTTVNNNYQPSASMPLTAFIGDPIYAYVFDIYHKQETDSTTQALRVYQNTAAGGANYAQKTNCLITIENYNIATGVITFSIAQSGTPTLGTATVTTGTDGAPTPVFTPETAA